MGDKEVFVPEQSKWRLPDDVDQSKFVWFDTRQWKGIYARCVDEKDSEKKEETS